MKIAAVSVVGGVFLGALLLCAGAPVGVCVLAGTLAGATFYYVMG